MTRLQLTYFLAVVEHGGFIKASRALFVSQPTLTQQINSLERELGFKLIQRHHQGISLTEEGEIMLQCFRQFDESFQQAYTQALKVSVGVIGSLSVGLLVMADMPDIPRKISAFCAERKGCSVRFFQEHLCDLGSMLLDGSLDFGFMFDDLAVAFPELELMPIFDSEYKIVLPADDPAAKKENFSVADLNGRTLYEFEYGYPAVQQTQRATSNALGLEHLPRMKVSSLETAYSMVASGLGIGIGSGHNNLLNGDRFSLIDTGVYHKMCIAWNPARISLFGKTCLRELFDAPFPSL